MQAKFISSKDIKVRNWPQEGGAYHKSEENLYRITVTKKNSSLFTIFVILNIKTDAEQVELVKSRLSPLYFSKRRIISSIHTFISLIEIDPV